MILPFSTQFKDRTPTDFIQKIWCGLIRNRIVLIFTLLDYKETKGEFAQKNMPDNPFEVVSFAPKLHTIREDIHNRWHEGCLIHPVVFNRSKNQFQFAPTLVCKSIQKIDIKHYDFDTVKAMSVVIDETEIFGQDIFMLAKNDGFNSVEDFFKWFDHDFTGKIIHWTDLKY